MITGAGKDYLPFLAIATRQSPDLSGTLATVYNPGMCLLALPVIMRPAPGTGFAVTFVLGCR